jgi:two-component system, OmpR family, sensor histidine kinase KdpD
VSDSWVQRARRSPDPLQALLWSVVLAAVTALMLPFRSHLNEAHVMVAYLLVVQGASARGGRTIGFGIVLAAFLAFDFLFLPPYYTLRLENPLDWLVLLAFLGTSALSAQLLHRAQTEAAAARDRAGEVDRLAALGAETLNVVRAEDALTAIASTIRSTLELDTCAVYGTSEAGAVKPLAYVSGTATPEDTTNTEIVEWVATNGMPVAEQLDGTTRVAIAVESALVASAAAPILRAYLRPLQVRGRTVGVLRMSKDAGLALTRSQIRILAALGYYAALGVERVRLSTGAQRAQELQEAHRAKDAILASVSHDLRTPLTTIKGLAHEITMDGDNRAAIIEEEADRLNVFVRDLLDLSRVNGGFATINVEANEAEDLIGAAAQRVRGRLGNHRLQIVLDPHHPLLFGLFDFAQTVRALVNLLENAAKYAPAGSAIELGVRRVGPTLEFLVADRGPGIPVTERDRIFDAFYRLPASMPDVGGAGLGLAIARGIANSQGGGLTYAAREQGGSIFTLAVPAIELSEIPAKETAAAS